VSRNFDILRREMPSAARVVEGEAGAQQAGATRTPDPIAIIDNEITRLVRQVFFLRGDKGVRSSVTFCGVNTGDGCSWVCTRAAEALAELVPGRVCLVDANLRSPSLHQHFHFDRSGGFADAMKNGSPIETLARPTWSSHLWVITAGEAGCDPGGALNPARARTRISELREGFDCLLFDAPPVSSYGDGALLGQLTDGVVLVVGCHSTRRETARAAKQSFEIAGVPILGTVLNKRTYPIPEALYRRL